MVAATVTQLHGVSEKKTSFWPLSMFYRNLDKSGSILIFSLRKDMRRKVELTTNTSPQICCCTTLQKVGLSVHLRSLIKQLDLIQFKVMLWHLITENVHEGCCFCLSTQINLPHVFKMSAFGTYARKMTYICVSYHGNRSLHFEARVEPWAWYMVSVYLLPADSWQTCRKHWHPIRAASYRCVAYYNLFHLVG